MSEIGLRRCKQCQEDKPLDRFYKRKIYKDGYAPRCKICYNEAPAKKRWRVENPEYDIAYRIKNRERVRKNALISRLRRLYNMTFEDYENLLSLQNNSCSICGAHKDTMDQSLCVDHNHKTAKVRGLLCDRCNKVLGMVGDDIDTLLKMVNYLESADTEHFVNSFNIDKR